MGTFFSETGNETSMFINAVSIQIYVGDPRKYGKEKKKSIMFVGGKERILTLVPDERIVYIENPNGFTHKFLELISEFCKIIRYNTVYKNQCISVYQHQTVRNWNLINYYPKTHMGKKGLRTVK